MATTEKITNVEAYNKYVKKYKSNIQAARQFMADEGVRGMVTVEKEEPLSIVTNKLGQDESWKVSKKCNIYGSFPVFPRSSIL